jgi:general secretion pathway protein C
VVASPLSVFSRLSGRAGGRRAIGDWLIWAAAALCIGLAANLFWILVGPAGSLGNWKPKPPTAFSASERERLFASSDPFARAAGQAEAPGTVTSLSLSLFGTRFNEFTGGGSAILAGADGVQQSYNVGDEIMPGVVLAKVAFDHVVLSRNGAEESLYMDQSTPADTVGTEPNAQASPAPAAAPSASGEVKLNAITLRDSIGVTPRNEGGKITGLVLSAKDDGAMMRNAGLAAGDIIVSVNGRPVSSPSEIASQLRPGAKLTLEVERGSQKIPVGLNLE